MWRAWIVAAALLPALLPACSVSDVDFTGKACPCRSPWLCAPDGRCVRGDDDHPSCADGGPFALSGGQGHTCSVECGALFCWGRGVEGQLGLGAPAPPSLDRPTRVGDRGDWVTVSAGGMHTCALDDERDVLCWGDNGDGQLGLGIPDANVPEPTVAIGPGGWVGISAGQSHTCGVRRDGRLLCWGDGSCGKLGLGSMESVDRATDVMDGGMGGWVSVVAGNTLSCGLRDDGSLWCWGCGDDAQLGGAAGPPSLVPRRVDHPEAFVHFDVAQQHVCAVDASGALSCWGRNSGAMIGIGMQGPAVEGPTRVDDGVRYLRTATHAFTSCGLREGGAVACWGQDLDGQLGRGVPDEDFQLTPAVVVGLERPSVDLTAGRFHTCARDERLSIHCVGNDVDGQLGTGTANRRNHAFERVRFPAQ